MSTRTDLNGMLRGDEDNLTLRLSDFFTKCEGKAAVINVRYLPLGGSAPEKLNADPIVVENPASGAVDNVIDAIERVVIEKLGHAPAGVLRVQGYVKGNATKTPLDMSRTLVPADLSGLGDPNLTLVRGLLDLKTRENAELHRNLVAMAGHVTILSGQLAQANAQLAAVRTAATAASDMQGITTLIALGLIVLFAPNIKAALGVSPDAPLDEAILAARRALAAATGKREPLPVASPPPSAYAPAPRELEDGQAPAPAAEVPRDPELVAVGEELGRWLKRLEDDPALRTMAFEQAMSSTTLKNAAQAAYMKASGLGG